MKHGMELIQPLLQGELPERVPVCCNLLEQGAAELGMSIDEYYSRGEYVAEGQLKLQEKYGNDVVWGFMHTATGMEILGSRHVVYPTDGPPNVGDLIIKSYEDIESLEIPEDIYEHEGFRQWRRCIELLASETGGRVPIVSNVVSAFTYPIIMMGFDKWLELLFSAEADLIDTILNKAHLFTTRLIRALRKSGANLISYSNPLGTSEFISHDQFLRLSLPWVKRDYEAAGSAGLVYFGGGGPILDQIEDVLEECGATAFYMHPDDDIRAAKQIVNGRGVVTGVINDMKLIRSWSREEIRDEVRRIMLEGGPGGGFMFGTLVMPALIPEENIRIMMDAAREFGRREYLEQTR
jgi:uroporphyrinogen-III decarboxylase